MQPNPVGEPDISARPAWRGRLRALVWRGAREAPEAVEQLVGGLGTAVFALVTVVGLAVVGLLCLLGIGLLLLSPALTLVRAAANLERGRLTRCGFPVISPYRPLPAGWRAQLGAARADPATARDLAWLAGHASLGFVLGLIGVALLLLALRDTTYVLWWQLIPAGEGGTALGFPVDGWSGAIAVGMLGLGWFALLLGLGPRLARLQAWPGLKLLGPPPGADLSRRVAELTATRAAALQAHTAELRRIERSLHDGTQSRLVGVAVLLGAARQAVGRNDPAGADAALERAQTAAEQALGELRGVIRGILPPILDDRGLDAALVALAAECAVPCQAHVTGVGHLPASVQATVYHTVAEALTNISRHSHARQARVEVRADGDRLRVRVHDDGQGGAREDGGSGLVGIRRRVQAHDGTVTVTSPPGGPTQIEAVLPCGS